MTKKEAYQKGYADALKDILQSVQEFYKDEARPNGNYRLIKSYGKNSTNYRISLNLYDAVKNGTPLPDLEPGKVVAFDFDGVIHKYSEGWKDGSIYDEPNMVMLDLIRLLQLANIPCVIISTREPKQIKEWWDKQGFTITAHPLCFDTKFFNDCTYVGITNRKIPAQLYIDDRAYRYSGQTVIEFLIDCSKNEIGQAKREESEDDSHKDEIREITKKWKESESK